MSGVVDIVDLRQVKAASSLPLFEQEENEWRQRLLWDRSGIVQVAEHLARQQCLPGWLLRRDGVGVAKVLLGMSGSTRTLELPYVEPGSRGSGLLAELLVQALQRLREDRRVKRIELGFFPFGEDVGRMERLDLQALPRLYMIQKLQDARPPAAGQQPSPEAFRLQGWPTSLASLSLVLQRAYEGTADGRAAEFYGTRKGCRKYLSRLVQSGECGRFAPALSGQAVSTAGEVVGFLLATVVSPGTAHVAQVAVLPAWRGQGVARALMSRYRHQARLQDLGRSTLLVTAANRVARSWYERQGYRPHLPFCSYWWERPSPFR